MRALLLFAAALLLAGEAPAQKVNAWWQRAGGDGAMYEFCRNGGKGVGLDGTTGLYSATCGNYNWSSEKGGSTASSTSFNTPTTAGGNSFLLTCTAAGVGTDQNGRVFNVSTELQSGAPTDATASGGGASTVTDADAGMAIDSYIGGMIHITGGTCSGQKRQIIDNTATVITVNSAWSACTPDATSTYTIFDSTGALCMEAGEKIKVNAMADLMLAQEMTASGGFVYLPKFTGVDHGIYANRMCGYKGMVGTSRVGNNCPVMRAPNNDHYQRTIDMGIRNITWKMEGVSDIDLELNGRDGVWLIDDTNSKAAGSFTSYDSADGTATNGGWNIRVGGTMAGRTCTPTAYDDCQPSSSISQSMDMSSWGRNFAWFNSATVTDPTQFCANNQDSVSGTCRGDRRVQCTADATCSAAGLDATCDSAAEALDYEADTLGRPIYIATTYTGVQFPEAAGSATTGTSDFWYAKVNSVDMGTSCGTGSNGKIVSFGPTFPTAQGNLRTGANFTVIDMNQWWSPKGGVEGGTFMPASWYGRDIDNDTVSDPGDCLSAGDVDETDDEPYCDTSELASVMSIAGAGFKGSIIARGSTETNSTFDGYINQSGGWVQDTTILQGKRGQISDLSSLRMERVKFLDNNSGSTSILNSSFVSAAKLEDVTFKGNTGSQMLSVAGGTGGYFRNLTFENNDVQVGLIRLDGPSRNFIFDGITAVNNDGPGITLSAWVNSLTNISFSRIRAWSNVGTSWTDDSFFTGASFINWTGFGADIPATVVVKNINFSDVQVDSQLNNYCFAYFDDDAATNRIDLARAQFSFRDVSLNAVNGATGQVMFCVADINAVGRPTAANDTGIMAQRYIPTWTNARLDGTAIPDQPVPAGPASQCGDCDTASLGGRVCHIYDDTAANGCTDAGADGILDGGGTARSICVCDAATTNWSPPGT